MKENQKPCIKIKKVIDRGKRSKTLSEIIRGEWPSGLRRCNQNRKVPGSNPTRRSAGLRGPTSLKRFPVTLESNM